MIVEGTVSVKAVLQANKRDIETLYIKVGKRSKDISYIKNLAKQHGVDIQMVLPEAFDQLVSGKTSGGIALACGPRHEESLDQLHEPKAIALLEGIEDPFNLGYCARSLYSFGFDALVLPKRNWDNAASQIIKSSAGAFEKLCVILTDDMVQTIQAIKCNGFTMVAAHRAHAMDIMEYTWPNKVLLAIGGEMRGLSSGVMAQVDQRIYIPYANGFRNALNASSAVAVLGYEFSRHHKEVHHD